MSGSPSLEELEVTASSEALLLLGHVHQLLTPPGVEAFHIFSLSLRDEPGAPVHLPPSPGLTFGWIKRNYMLNLMSIA